MFSRAELGSPGGLLPARVCVQTASVPPSGPFYNVIYSGNFEDTLCLAFLPIRTHKCLLLVSCLLGSVFGAKDTKITKMLFLS